MDTIRDTQKGADNIRKANHREYIKQYMAQRRQSIKLPSECIRDKRCGNTSKGSEKFSKIHIETNKSEDKKIKKETRQEYMKIYMAKRKLDPAYKE